MPIAPTLAPAAATRPWLMKLLKPLAGWYSNAAGYRQMGLL
jgi:ubiquinol-cytochrome c reductase subunit 7